jgi:hypothetical protein
MAKETFTVNADGVIGVSGTQMIGNVPAPTPAPKPVPAHAAFTLDEERQILDYFEGDPATKGWDTFQKLQSYMYLLEQGLAPPLRKVEPPPPMGGAIPRGAISGRSTWNGVGKPPQPMEARIVQQGLRVAQILQQQEALRQEEELRKAQELRAQEALKQSRGS